MSLVITGASGRLARLAAAYALEHIEPDELVLVTRHPEPLAAVMPPGVHVRFGDFDDPASLEQAFAGAETMLLVSTMDVGRRTAQHKAAIDAAVKAGVRHISYTSGLNSTPENPAYVVEEHAESDALVEASGVAWTVLANGLYSELRVPQGGIEAVRTGRYIHNAGDGVTAYVSRADCADVAVGVLLKPGFENMVLDVTGPQLHTQAQVAEILADVTGRPVRAVEVTTEEKVRMYLEDGVDDYSARSSASWGDAIKKGALSALSTAVRDVTGREPRTLHSVLADHRDELLGGTPYEATGEWRGVPRLTGSSTTK